MEEDLQDVLEPGESEVDRGGMHDSMECGSDSYVVACCAGAVAVGVHILDGSEGEFGLLSKSRMEGFAIVIPGDDVQETGFGGRA